MSVPQFSISESGPPRLLEFFFPTKVALGDEIIVSCVVGKSAAGPYAIAWSKDGSVLKDSGRVSVSSAHSRSSATLRIASLRPEDVGNYTCTASNSFGSDSFTAQLVVHGKLDFGVICPRLKETCRNLRAPILPRKDMDVYSFADDSPVYA
ncbi:hypothetical protein V5799_008410 [Amblyomma americanum]|uniref:Ig-like domain-containing protein n=1 Tax=Amblyomma americanum TaxID=6943 RepID=A0AAQ4FDC3_AMBAM